MSLTDNQKLVGWAFFIVGILMIVSALLGFYDAISKDGGLGENIGYFIAAIGGLIAAVLYFLYGNKVRTNAISGKFNILSNYIRIVGVNTVIVGIFSAIGGIISSIGFWDSIIMIILGLIVIWAAGKIADGEKTAIDKILWIVLTLVFLILFITSFLGIFAMFDIIVLVESICYAVIYLFMFLYMIDGDVRSKML